MSKVERHAEPSEPYASYESVFRDLVRRGFELNKPGKLIKLNPQPVQTAVLYGPGTGVRHPLHLHHERALSQGSPFTALEPYVSRASTKKDQRGWEYYDITDWHRFHEAVLRYRSGEPMAHTASRLADRSAVARMVATARATVVASNGQQVTRTVKEKDLRFASAEAFERHIHSLLTAQDWRCAITGIQLQEDSETADVDLLCSMDRIDSDGHYSADNLQIVCRFVNRWKSDDDDRNFRRLIDLIRDTSPHATRDSD